MLGVVGKGSPSSPGKKKKKKNFGRNATSIHGVMTDYFRKIRSKVCHAYRVNSFEESVENCYVDGATIVGVPFCGLKGIGIKTTEI